MYPTRWIGLTAVALLLTAGCGGEDEGSGDDGASGSGGSAAAAGSGGRPGSGGSGGAASGNGGAASGGASSGSGGVASGGAGSGGATSGSGGTASGGASSGGGGSGATGGSGSAGCGLERAGSPCAAEDRCEWSDPEQCKVGNCRCLQGSWACAESVVSGCGSCPAPSEIRCGDACDGDGQSCLCSCGGANYTGCACRSGRWDCGSSSC